METQGPGTPQETRLCLMAGRIGVGEVGAELETRAYAIDTVGSVAAASSSYMHDLRPAVSYGGLEPKPKRVLNLLDYVLCEDVIADGLVHLRRRS